MMKHCVTCTCEKEVVEMTTKENCPACRRTYGRKPVWDVHEWAERIKTGELNQNDIAALVGISRQGVDQAIRKHGLRQAVLDGEVARKEARKQRDVEKKHEREQALIAKADSPRPYEHIQQYSDENLIQALQAMYEFLRLDGAMSHFVYNDLRPKNLPSAPTIMDRFGTWNAACEAAGLPVNRAPRKPDEYARYTKEKALGDVKRYILEYRAENGRYATISNIKYDEWARNKDNRAASRAHITKKYGWSELVGEAMKELYGNVDAKTGS